MAHFVRVNGTKIRALREEVLAMDRREVAELLGITPHNLYLIEVYRQTTSLKTLRRLARLLGVKPADLSRVKTPVTN